MNYILTIYLIGAIISFILGILITYKYWKNGNDIELMHIIALICLTLMSWVTAISLIIYYICEHESIILIKGYKNDNRK